MSEHYDYLVIGAGSAGSVIAARLTEDPDVTVLLLESGPAGGPPEVAVPAAWPVLMGSSADYGYETVPQRGLNDTVQAYPRGNLLGGSGSINALVFLRGHPAGYDAWAKAGADGWDYQSVLPYFRRMETVPGGDPRFRGDRGPLHPSTAVDPHPLSEVFIDAAVASGFPRTDDFNGEFAEGVGWNDLSIVDGRRESTATAYLQPVMGRRPNLTVLTEARTQRLLIENDRCIGVEYVKGGRLLTAYADREVVLSAGSVDSPRLLLLSGIGDAAELERVGVPVTHHLPGVGRNLQDHPRVTVAYEASQPIPAGVNNLAESSLLWRSDPSLAGPDLQLMFAHVAAGPPSRELPVNSYTFLLTTVPEARGTIRLADADPSTPPLIDPNYLGAESDVRRLLQAIEVARTVGEAAPFGPWRLREVLPGAEVTDEAALRAYLAADSANYYHPVGTCTMGTTTDAVVDPALRVHGIDGLRVADASVIPHLPCVNTNPATIMIAERAAGLLRQ